MAGLAWLGNSDLTQLFFGRSDVFPVAANVTCEIFAEAVYIFLIFTSKFAGISIKPTKLQITAICGHGKYCRPSENVPYTVIDWSILVLQSINTTEDFFIRPILKRLML
jgi:hypothetical protein